MQVVGSSRRHCMEVPHSPSAAYLQHTIPTNCLCPPQPHPPGPLPPAFTGIPSVFCEHLFDWGEEVGGAIRQLIALRKRNGINSFSKLEILTAEDDMYVARIDDK